ncbi:MAG: PIG-L deacetylase family protein [Promethearchaeota archaeon]
MNRTNIVDDVVENAEVVNGMKGNIFGSSTPKRVLIFEAHSDDAVIGMGATIKLMSESGIEVVLCTVTKGETQHSDKTKENIITIRKNEGLCADKILGVTNHVFFDHGCQAVENDRPTFHEFVEMIRNVKPGLIFTHSEHEWHRDHRAISKLAEEAWWKATEKDVLIELGEPHRARALLFYEVIPMFTRNPDVCLDVSAYWEFKKDAIKCFASQTETMNNFFNLINGKGMYRGYLVNCQRAEAFIYSRFLPRTGLF